MTPKTPAPAAAAAEPKKKATSATFDLVSSEAGKFSIKSLDKGALLVTAQFNPTGLEITKDVPWAVPGDAGGGNGNTKQGSGGIEMQFTGAKGRTFSVELLIDDVDSSRKGDVAGKLAMLEEMATVIDPKSKEENKRRPHWCVATWGPALPGFRCVITNLKTKYEVFDPDGKPLRVRVTLALAEASSVSIKDKNAPPPTNTSGSSTPPPAGGAH